MSRLDQHIGAVRRKMALGIFVESLGWAALMVASALLLGVLVYKFIGFRVPPLTIALAAGIGVLVSLGWAIYRRPSARHAAVQIDQKLNLFEKFSTALYVRRDTDAFSQAAVRDAEQSAEKVNLAGQFGLELPQAAFWAIPIAVAAILAMYLPLFDVFGHREAAKNHDAQIAKVEAVRKIAKDNLAQVDVVDVKHWGDPEQVKQIRKALEQIVDKPITDVDKAQVTAAQAMQDLNKAMQDEAKRVKDAAKAQEEARKTFAVPTPGADETGPVADAHRDIANGDVGKALDKLEKLTDKFDKLDQKEQEKAAEQMANLARELQKRGDDPAVQEEAKKALQQQLQAMGQDPEKSKEQAQQMQKLMQQAAAGNKDAAQQVQQMAKQAAQQMNGGQGPNPQQQQAIQKLQQQIAQGQANANAQSQAGQMAQAAQQMAQAMQQGAQQQAGQPSAKGQNGGSQSGQAMAQSKQAMQQAMQNAVGQMQAMKQDAADIANAQQQAAAAAGQAAGQIAAGQQGQNGPGQNGQGQGGQGKNGQGQGQGQGAGQGQWKAGDPGQQQANGQGQGGPGVGAGGSIGKQDAPFDTIHANSPTLNDPNGKVIANTLIRDGQFIKGTDTAKIREVAAAGQRDQTEDVDDSRVDRKSAQLTKEYFRTMEAESNKK